MGLVEAMLQEPNHWISLMLAAYRMEVWMSLRYRALHSTSSFVLCSIPFNVRDMWYGWKCGKYCCISFWMHKDKWCRCDFVSVVSSFHDTKVWVGLTFVSNETHWTSAWVAKLCWSVCNHGCFLCHAQGLFEIKVDSSSGAHWHKTISRASKEAIYKVSAIHVSVTSMFCSSMLLSNLFCVCM